MGNEKRLERSGYVYHPEYYCFIRKFQDDIEVTIELCIGDRCVGIFQMEELLEPKVPCPDLMHALLEALKLERKYNLIPLDETLND